MVDLSNTDINSLEFDKETLLTHEKGIRTNGASGRLCLRVRTSSKTWILKLGDLKITLGDYCPNEFNFHDAMYKCMQIMKGDIDETETTYAPTFRRMIDEVLKYKEETLNHKSNRQARTRLNLVPKAILDKPITMLSFKDAKKLRESVLLKSTPIQFNNIIADLRAYWNRGKRDFYREELEGKDNPFANLTIENIVRNKRPLPSFEDILTIWKQVNEFEIDDYWKLFWKLKIALGCHSTELMKMTNDNMIEDRLGTWFYWPVNHHKISNYKNGIEHRVYIHPKLKELITEHLRAYEIEKYWFYSRSLNNGEDKYKMMNEVGASTRWQRFKKDSNVAFPNDTFRHCLYTYLYGKRMNPEVVTGHCYRGTVGKEHYMNWANPDILEQFKETANCYQQALVDALGEDF